MQKLFAACLSVVFISLAPHAWALDPVPFSDRAFRAAQSAGKPILVHVTAPWCPTCAQQKPILQKLEQSAEFGDMVVFDIDFDHQKDLLRRFNVQMQSTLIVFSGTSEKGRATGVTDPDRIRALLLKAKAA